uniref:Uncharacterized protein n=1 Tax=Anguilla anguilla TaxID=7936 RepID=A0A0E9W3E4_ANGAN
MKWRPAGNGTINYKDKNIRPLILEHVCPTPVISSLRDVDSNLCSQI